MGGTLIERDMILLKLALPIYLKMVLVLYTSQIISGASLKLIDLKKKLVHDWQMHVCVRIFRMTTKRIFRQTTDLNASCGNIMLW